MTAPSTLWKVSAYWAARFGCPVQLLSGPEITAVAHSALARWHGGYLFRHGNACILSVPESYLDAARAAAAGCAHSEVFSIDFARSLFGEMVDRIIGPAWLGYADASDFHPVETLRVRRLTAEDRSALVRFAAECGDAWQDSGIDIDRSLVFGRFVDRELVAAGTVDASAPHILNIGIITHPDWRSHGHGRAVVSAMTAYGLERGAVLQYRTLETNLASMRIARQLGFQHYGSTIAVRLQEAAAVTGSGDSFDRVEQA